MAQALKGENRKRGARGFTFVEVLLAMVVLVVGLVAVVQLVPASIESNMRNRYDSNAVLIAERLLDQMLSQPITATTFVDADGRVIALGSVTASGLTGNPLVVMNGTARVNFAAPAVANYNFNYTVPNDPTGTIYQVRWGVISTVSGLNVVSKRFVVGVWRRDTRGVTQPVTLEAMVQR
jgi:prepilin-type N-terminal cleavage/methylation domain-containing protein